MECRHVEVSQHIGHDFWWGMTEIAWRAQMVGSARCADSRTLSGQRGVPTVVSTRSDFERLTNDVISSEAKDLCVSFVRD